VVFPLGTEEKVDSQCPDDIALTPWVSGKEWEGAGGRVRRRRWRARSLGWGHEGRLWFLNQSNSRAIRWGKGGE
jgi:hypothetical protein